MYEILLRKLPAPVVNVLMAVWYALVLFLLWIVAPSALNIAFRYAEI